MRVLYHSAPHGDDSTSIWAFARRVGTTSQGTQFESFALSKAILSHNPFDRGIERSAMWFGFASSDAPLQPADVARLAQPVAPGPVGHPDRRMLGVECGIRQRRPRLQSPIRISKSRPDYCWRPSLSSVEDDTADPRSWRGSDNVCPAAISWNVAMISSRLRSRNQWSPSTSINSKPPAE